MTEIHGSELVLVLFPHFVTCLTKYPTQEGDVRWLTSVWIHSPIYELFLRPTIVLNTGNESVMSGLSVSMGYSWDRNNQEAYGSDALRVRKGGLRCKGWRSGKVTRIRDNEGYWLREKVWRTSLVQEHKILKVLSSQGSRKKFIQPRTRGIVKPQR